MFLKYEFIKTINETYTSSILRLLRKSGKQFKLANDKEKTILDKILR